MIHTPINVSLDEGFVAKANHEPDYSSITIGEKFTPVLGRGNIIIQPALRLYFAPGNRELVDEIVAKLNVIKKGED